MKTSRNNKSARVVLAIDVGGSHVKVMTSTGRTKREFESGPDLSAKEMVRRVKAEIGLLSVAGRGAIRYEDSIHENIERAKYYNLPPSLARSLSTMESVISCRQATQQEHKHLQNSITRFCRWRESKEFKDIMSCYGLIRKKLMRADHRITGGLHLS